MRAKAHIYTSVRRCTIEAGPLSGQNFSEKLDKTTGTPYQEHVSAAKAAVDATSAVLAVEEGPHGVRSNVIAPGPIAGTVGMDRLSRHDEKGQLESSSWATPVGRMGDSRDVANMAVFLFSDAASFVSGQVIVVDGASEHIRGLLLPYPQGVLDPASVKHLITPRL